MIKWLKPKAKHPNHEQCDCTERTQVDGQGKKYWPRDANGKPTGHHPSCEYYVPPLPPRP